MGYFYFDESIHDRAGFIVGAFVYSEHISPSKNFDAIKKRWASTWHSMNSKAVLR